MTSIEHDSTTYPDAFTTKVELHEDMKALVRECILNNSDVRIETNDAEMKYEPKGQALEVGLINFLVDNKEDVLNSLIERNRNQPKLAMLPFDQVLKRKSFIRQIAGEASLARIYVKGAPESVVTCCTKTHDQSMEVKDLEDPELLLSNVVSH